MTNNAVLSIWWPGWSFTTLMCNSKIHSTDSRRILKTLFSKITFIGKNKWMKVEYFVYRVLMNVIGTG